jgi:hypothetical protein
VKDAGKAREITLLLSGTPRASGDDVRMLKIVALGYLVKTLLVAIAWLVIPDLPQRAAAKARAVWTSVREGAQGRAASGGEATR